MPIELCAPTVTETELSWLLVCAMHTRIRRVRQPEAAELLAG